LRHNRKLSTGRIHCMRPFFARKCSGSGAHRSGFSMTYGAAYHTVNTRQLERDADANSPQRNETESNCGLLTDQNNGSNQPTNQIRLAQEARADPRRRHAKPGIPVGHDETATLVPVHAILPWSDSIREHRLSAELRRPAPPAPQLRHAPARDFSQVLLAGKVSPHQSLCVLFLSSCGGTNVLAAARTAHALVRRLYAGAGCPSR
jgi:hypothetical protein